MPQVFISHVEEDAPLALQLALVLETGGYRTWCYEVDSVPGLSYLDQWARAIEACECLLLIISRQACVAKETNVDNEVTQAHESQKVLIPVLRGVSQSEWQKEKPGWRAAIGPATSISVTAKGAPGALPGIQLGLNARGIQPQGAPSDERLKALEERLDELGVADRPFNLTKTSEQTLSRRLLEWTRTSASQRTVAGALVAAVGAVMLTLATWTLIARWMGPVVVGVMEFRGQQLAQNEDWIRWNTRNSLIVMLSNVRNINPGVLRVYDEEQIDEVQKKFGLTSNEAAEKLGIHKIIKGTIARSDSDVILHVRVIDIRSSWLEHMLGMGGKIDGAFDRQGPMAEIAELQNGVAADLLGTLNIQLTAEGRESLFAKRSRGNDMLSNYKQLKDHLADFYVDDAPTTPHASSEKNSQSSAWGVGVAQAQDLSDKAAIEQLLKRYSSALEAKKVEEFADLHVDLNERQRDSLRRYFDNAEDLHVRISSIDIAVNDGEALATFTRTDQFREAPTGRSVELEVRLSSILTKQNGHWKIRGLKKPS